MVRGVALVLTGGAAAAAGSVAIGTAAGDGDGEPPRIVRVVAHQFAYDPPVIRLRRGERVVIELTSRDRPHGLRQPTLGLRLDALPDQVARATLRPEQAGSFLFVCDVFCGLDHDEMEGRIDVAE